jgi:molybdopterin converting factor small subunit
VGLFDGLKRALGRDGDTIRVHLILKGRTATGWYDVDEHLVLPKGATLATLLEHARAKKLPLEEALATSPHLAHTLMHNGERCPVHGNLDRPLADGDQLYLLAPLAGG